jgi:hypothetical protein
MFIDSRTKRGPQAHRSCRSFPYVAPSRPARGGFSSRQTRGGASVRSGETGAQARGGHLEPGRVAVWAGHQQRPFQAADDNPRRVPGRPGEGQAALVPALLKDRLQPALVVVEEPGPPRPASAGAVSGARPPGPAGGPGGRRAMSATVWPAHGAPDTRDPSRPGRRARIPAGPWVLSEGERTVDRSANWCSSSDLTSPAGRTCVLIIRMAQVLPGMAFRPADNRPDTKVWPVAAGQRTVTVTDGGIIRHGRPHRQSHAEAGCGAKRGHGRRTCSAGPPCVHDRRPAGPPHGAAPTATATRVCRSGTGHPPEEGQ